MIYFLYGLDTYRSRKRLGEIITEFGKKIDAAVSVTRVDAGDDPDAVLAVGRTDSLFSAKELAESTAPLGEVSQDHAHAALGQGTSSSASP